MSNILPNLSNVPSHLREKLINIINDENVQFFICATPQLVDLIVKNEHPHIKKLSFRAKRAFLAGKVTLLAKEDVLDFVLGKLKNPHKFLLENAEIRVVGEPSIQVKPPS